MAEPGYTYQAATALYLGQRDNQEDALATDFSVGSDMGFVVLSDGMGGHNAGDIASKVVVTEVFSELKLQSGDRGAFRGKIREILHHATELANACIADVVDVTPEAEGMGATLTVPVFMDDQLFWISVGDSPLYLYRSGHLRQLNEDHSMAPHIDLMVRTGMISESGGREHPDRNCLTSVLVGRQIAKIDCPEMATQLFDGDIVIAASDGLQMLEHTDLRDIITRHSHEPSDRIVHELLREIKELDHPEQDNISMAVVKVNKTAPQTRATPVHDTGQEQSNVVELGMRERGRRRLPGLRRGLARLLPAATGPAD